jgi:hypothetical protein
MNRFLLMRNGADCEYDERSRGQGRGRAMIAPRLIPLPEIRGGVPWGPRQSIAKRADIIKRLNRK